ncbi:MAG: hypothetical protein P1U42_07700 [Phycisphaerales bacterium]|nr:hypothetical protein [Phycisphaerales bacterium]
MDSNPTSNKTNKSTWELHVRPLGAKHEPWQTMRVAARSAIQADAILRRQGYESLIESARVVNAKPDPEQIAQLKPLECARCGYLLAGLTIESSSVTCPECSYQQSLVAWKPEIVASLQESKNILISIFAAIGIVTVVILALLFFLALSY